METQILCPKCGVTKPQSLFAKNKSRKSGYNGHCKMCHQKYRADNIEKALKNNREHKAKNKEKAKKERPDYLNRPSTKVLLRRRRLKNTYGITDDDYRLMMGLQEGRCAICREQFDFTGTQKGMKAEIDHCHTTKKVRGLLCGHCNRALGLFRDDKNRLLEAIKYLG